MVSKSTTVLTLDAGGTNFVFSAISDYREIMKPVTLPSNADDLDRCLATIIAGFEQIADQVGEFDAISFAFPGPADYELGIIGDLPNFRAFKGGVPLGPMLESRFKVPVFINNDGNLFASGAAKDFLPELNNRLRQAGSKKQFQNLIGITLGTGFGCGILCKGQLLTGDNSCGAEIHNTLNPFNHNWNAEESVSTRAIQRVYAEETGIPSDAKLMPKEIHEIAKGARDGNSTAANEAFIKYGQSLGASIANVLTLIDGVVVIGGGLSGGWDLFAPPMFKEVNRQIETYRTEKVNRLSFKVFNLEDETVFEEFARGSTKSLSIPGTDETIQYDSLHRTGIGLYKPNSSLAIALGAYAFAVEQISGTAK